MAKRGFYRHYKGDVYFVEGVGQIDHQGPRIVAYQSKRGVETNEMQFRWENEFDGWVHPATKEETRDHPYFSEKAAIANGWVRRFERIEPT